MKTQRNTTNLTRKQRREPGRSPLQGTDPHEKDVTQHNPPQPDRQARRSLGRSNFTAIESSLAAQTLANTASHSSSSYSRQIRINIHLFDTLQNAVNSAISGGNYRYGSAADFIREALKDYAETKQLLLNVEKGVRKLMSLRLDEDLKNFWDSLPNRQKPNILERAIRTKLLNTDKAQLNAS